MIAPRVGARTVASFPATSETPGGVGIIAILLAAVMAVTGQAGLAERLARHLGTT
jgi:hypothetical protein